MSGCGCVVVTAKTLRLTGISLRNLAFLAPLRPDKYREHPLPLSHIQFNHQVKEVD